MIDPNTLLQRLRRSLHILEQRQAKLGINAPPDLILEIEDHQTAIRLTEQLAAGYLAEAAWREQLQPLLVKIEERQATEPISSLNIGGVNFDNISNSTITVGNITTGVHAGGDVIGGDKVTQTAEGSHIAQASHGGHAEVKTTTIDQRGQQVGGNQYNAVGDIHVYEAAPARPIEPIPTRIPPPRTGTFVGRSDDLDWLCHRLKAGDVAAVAGVRGIGGIGKTELAIAAANRLKPHFGEAHILWLECGPNDVYAIQERLAAALGVLLIGDDLRLRADSLALALQQHPATLVVLDDIRHRHLADFRYLLPPRPPCALLVTSRRDDLPVIPWPAIKKLEVLAPAQAELLLSNLLADLGLTPEPELVTEICALLEHIPLALTLAARRAGQLARRRRPGVLLLTTLLAELQQRRRVLVLELGQRPDVSIIATFQISYDELSKGDQARLGRLGVFARNEFELPAVQAVWAATAEDARRTLLNLTNAGLLEEVDDQVWWMHDLLREYAGDQLAQAGADESNTAYLNHAEFWRGYLANLTLRSLTDWHDLAAHRPEVESAAEWLAHTPTSPLYLQVQLPYAVATTFPDATFPWLTATLGAALTAAQQWQATAADEDERNSRTVWLARTQSSLADLLKNRGQYEEAERLYRASLAVKEEIGDRRSVAVTQSSLADLLKNRGQYEEAERLYRASLAIKEEIGDRREMAVTQSSLADLLSTRGQYEEAERLYRASLAVKEEIGDRREMAVTQSSLADFLSTRGQYEEAEQLYRASLAVFEEIGDRREMAVTQSSLAALLYTRGQYEEAERLFRAGLAVFEEIGDRRSVAMTQSSLADLLKNRGRYEEAERLYRASLAVKEEIGDHRSVAVTQSSLADLLKNRGQYEEAEQQYQASLTVFEGIGDRREMAVTQSRLADLLKNRGQYDEAERLYQSGLAICREIRELQGIGVFLMGLGRLRLAQGRRDEAVTMFQEAQQHFLAIGLSNWAASAEQLLQDAQT